jgi:hypothetical protein
LQEIAPLEEKMIATYKGLQTSKSKHRSSKQQIFSEMQDIMMQTQSSQSLLDASGGLNTSKPMSAAKSEKMLTTLTSIQSGGQAKANKVVKRLENEELRLIDKEFYFQPMDRDQDLLDSIVGKLKFFAKFPDLIKSQLI